MTLEAKATRAERFERLYEENVEAVRRYVWRREPAIADDVVAETFLVAWRRLDDVPEAARPWLIGVARNVRLNLRRGRRRQEAVVQRIADTSPQPAAADTSDLVHAALARLGPRDREVLLLAVWDVLDRTAIAQVLGCSKANASLRLHRARRRFAAAMDDLEEGDARAIATRSLVSGGADV